MNGRVDVKKFKEISIPALLLAITFGVCGPIQLYLTNMQELWFSIGDIWWMCLLCGAILFLACVGVGMLLPKRIASYYGVLLFAVALGLYIQGNFFPTDYGVLDGREIQWDEYRGTAIVNTFFWLACIGVPVVLQWLRPIWIKKTLPLVCVLVTAMQIVSVGILFVTNGFGMHQTKGYLSEEGINTVSAEENVIIFLIDSFDQEYFEKIYSSDLDFLEPLEGFIYFDNATGMYPTTKGSLPYILTGQLYENEQPYDEYIEEAFHATEYYSDLISAGYDIGIYTNPLFVPSYASDYFVNYVDGGVQVSSYEGLAKTLYKFACFRYFPHVLKESFWFYSGEFDQWKMAEGNLEYKVYDLNNIPYYNRLKEDGLQIVEEPACYRFIHISGVHVPYAMNENVEEVTDGSATAEDASRGCLNILYTYLGQLKQLGIYDKSTVVVMADHGAGVGRPTNPIFMIKPQESRGELTVNSAPVYQGDLFATVMEDIGLNRQGKYGRSVFDIQPGEDRERKFLYYNWDDSWDSAYLPPMTEYRIDSQANDSENFHLVNYEVNVYELGQTIGFQSSYAGLRAADYCITGFSIPEDTFTWTSDKTAKMAFKLDSLPEENLLVRMDIDRVLNGNQEVLVTVEGETVYTGTHSGKGTLEFVIPGDLLEDDVLELNFEFPYAISPMELNGGTDVRTLAVGFTSMTLEETDLTPDEVASSMSSGALHYNLGQELIFTQYQDDTNYFTSGVSSAEERFTWSLGTQGEMKMIIEEADADLWAEFTLEGAITEDQTISISSGEEVLYDGSVPTGKSIIQFSISQSCINDGTLVLHFEYPNAVAPNTINPESNDMRILAVRFSKLVISQETDH